MSWLSAAWHWYAAESVSQTGAVDHPHAALVNPVVASIGAALLIGAALQQAATARRRHREQTDADRQRRITESFSKATEQLGSDKVEGTPGRHLHVGAHLTREPSRLLDGDGDALCVCAERARWQKSASPFSEEAAEPKTSFPTDIAAVLAVIVRRDEKNRRREREQEWRLDFHGTDLRGANLIKANLFEANLSRANLSGAALFRANLSGAILFGPISAGPISGRPT